MKNLFYSTSVLALGLFLSQESYCSQQRHSSSSDEIREEITLGQNVHKYQPENPDNLSLKDVISLINDDLFDDDIDHSTKEGGKYINILKNNVETEECSEDAIRYAYEELEAYYKRTQQTDLLKKMYQ